MPSALRLTYQAKHSCPCYNYYIIIIIIIVSIVCGTVSYHFILKVIRFCTGLRYEKLCTYHATNFVVIEALRQKESKSKNYLLLSLSTGVGVNIRKIYGF